MKILCAIDFSEVSAHVAKYSSSLAQNTGSTLEFIFVQPFMVASVEADPTFSASLFEELRQQNLETLAEWAGRYQAQNYTLKIGSPAEEICDYAVLENFDLVTCGHTGAGEAQALILGSTAESLILQCKKPVLIIHPEFNWRELKKVIFATDFGDMQSKLPQFLPGWFKRFQSEVILLHVTGIEEDLDAANAQHVLNGLKETLPGTPIRFENYFSDDKVFGIEDTADNLDADLIVALHRSRGFFQRIIHPAFTKKLARNLKRPLLVLEL